MQITIWQMGAETHLCAPILLAKRQKGAETRLHAPKLLTVKADGGENRPFRPGVMQRWSLPSDPEILCRVTWKHQVMFPPSNQKNAKFFM